MKNTALHLDTAYEGIITSGKLKNKINIIAELLSFKINFYYIKLMLEKGFNTHWSFDPADESSTDKVFN